MTSQGPACLAGRAKTPSRLFGLKEASDTGFLLSIFPARCYRAWDQSNRTSLAVWSAASSSREAFVKGVRRRAVSAIAFEGVLHAMAFFVRG